MPRHVPARQPEGPLLLAKTTLNIDFLQSSTSGLQIAVIKVSATPPGNAKLTFG
jgi:hypothetical protein